MEDSGAESIHSYGSFVERMIEILRRSPVLHVGVGKTVELGNIRPPAKSLSLSAEGVALNATNGGPKAPPYEGPPEAAVACGAAPRRCRTGAVAVPPGAGPL